MAKQIQTNFRTPPEMKKQLEAAAEANGTTFNKEVNRRLGESFDLRRNLDPAVNDPVLLGMLVAIARAMQMTGMPVLLFTDHTQPERNWHRDPYAYARACEAAIEMLNLFRPEGEETPPDLGPDHHKLSEAIKEMGRMNARGTARGLASDLDVQKPPGGITESLIQLLGEEMIARIRKNLERSQ